MLKYQFPANQLSFLLEEFYSKQKIGTLEINVKLQEESQKCYFLVINKGAITYASLELLDGQKMAKNLLKKLNSNITGVTVDVVSKKLTNPLSFQDILNRLIKLQFLKWDQIISCLQQEVVKILEQILPLPGELTLISNVDCDLQLDQSNQQLAWPTLKEKIVLRQKQWESLAPNIPSVNAVPYITINRLDKVTEPAVKQHLQTWVDGKHTIGDIAENLNKDPLVIAQSYSVWKEKNWITFDKNLSTANEKLPIILSVDDSPIVQTTMKRILGNHYNLLLASNAVEALNLLNKNQVSVLLLDLTMPDVDGLEMCRTLRSIPKFHELPIIMVTARDGFVSKIKGKMAGTNRYLTKPFDAEQLLSVVSEFVSCGNT